MLRDVLLRRKTQVLAITSTSKMDMIRDLGADHVFDRHQKNLEQNIREIAPGGKVNAVAVVVGGSSFSMYLNLLCRGGRYVTSGAIADPLLS